MDPHNPNLGSPDLWAPLLSVLDHLGKWWPWFAGVIGGVFWWLRPGHTRDAEKSQAERAGADAVQAWEEAYARIQTLMLRELSTRDTEIAELTRRTAHLSLRLTASDTRVADLTRQMEDFSVRRNRYLRRITELLLHIRDLYGSLVQETPEMTARVLGRLTTVRPTEKEEI